MSGVDERCEQLSRQLRLESGVDVAVTAIGEFGLLGPRNSPRDGDGARKRTARGAALMEAALAWRRRRESGRGDGSEGVGVAGKAAAEEEEAEKEEEEEEGKEEEEAAAQGEGSAVLVEFARASVWTHSPSEAAHIYEEVRSRRISRRIEPENKYSELISANGEYLGEYLGGESSVAT